jgi:hypothetical protein
VYKRRIKTRQTGFLFDSLLLLSFYTLSWSFLSFVAQANDFSINFWWKLEPQHSSSRQNSFCYSFLPQCFRLSFFFRLNRKSFLFRIFSSP